MSMSHMSHMSHMMCRNGRKKEGKKKTALVGKWGTHTLASCFLFLLAVEFVLHTSNINHTHTSCHKLRCGARFFFGWFLILSRSSKSLQGLTKNVEPSRTKSGIRAFGAGAHLSTVEHGARTREETWGIAVAKTAKTAKTADKDEHKMYMHIFAGWLEVRVRVRVMTIT